MHGTFHANSTIARSNAGMPFFRIAALERMIVDRYGEARLPDDEGRDILGPIADHLAQIDPGRIRPWAAEWMPTLPTADIDELTASREAVIAECGKRALNWGADELAHHVEQDDATRTRLKNWCFGATDCDKAEREARRKITRAAAARATRAAAGATPREQSATATKPWIKDGFSCRRTWERHGKRPRVANSRPATSSPSMLVTDLRQQSDRAAGAVREMGQAGDAASSIAKPLSSPSSRIGQTIDTVAAALECERLQLQERARLHLNEVVANMMRSDEPAFWQPLFIAATSEWNGHNLLDDDGHHHSPNPH
jgi:broad specificity phosphatase PhoE